MRVLLYEWCCSGGLTSPDGSALLTAGATATDLEPLAREGRAMLLAVIRDGLRDPSLELHAVVDATRPLTLPTAVRIDRAAAGGDQTKLVAAAWGCDIAMIIAPETGGILARRVAEVRAAGIEVAAPGPNFLRLAGDKQATILALAAAGVPVPAGRGLAAGQAWPAMFHRPAVGKRLDGVGCDGFLRVEVGDPPPAVPRLPLRIEAAVTGLPVGVACLCRDGCVEPLPPMRQRFSGGTATGYTGGDPILDRELCRRATSLAVRSVAALERAAGDEARGWVGVDMMLGPRTDGRADRVLEVNPRLTTSFLGHAAAARSSLLRRLIAPMPTDAPSHPIPHAFDVSDGAVAS